MAGQGQTSQSSVPLPPPSSSAPTTHDHDAGPSTSSASTSSVSPTGSSVHQGNEEGSETVVEVRVDEYQEDDHNQTAQPEDYNYNRHRHHSRRHHNRHDNRASRFGPYRVRAALQEMAPHDMRDDVWSCLVVLATFWFFAASMTLILGFYGSENLQLGPNCSRLIEASPFFVRSIKAQEVDDQTSGPMLYGFHKSPSLDVESTWEETHTASIQSDFHKEWVYYLNSGSKVEITYNVTNPTYAPVSLVIAQGRENLVEWIEDPSYPNTTLSWNIIYGSGTIQQDIYASASYFIAVGNLNSETVSVDLNFTTKALLYDTSEAYYKCSLYNRVCSFRLYLFKANAAILTSPTPEEVTDDDGWYIKVSYGPRWVSYFVGSAILTVVILALFRACNLLRVNQDEGTGHDVTGIDREPLLFSPKVDDLSSWGSSYDSVSNDDEDLEELQVPDGSVEGKEGEANNVNPRRVCIICFECPRECFFLPCGHCAACYTCGSRTVEECGTCPICRRQIRNVRKIFSV